MDPRGGMWFQENGVEVSMWYRGCVIVCYGRDWVLEMMGMTQRNGVRRETWVPSSNSSV